MKKVFLVSAVLVTLALAFYWWEEHSPVSYPAGEGKADWITYSNHQYGFEFRHPADWRVSILGASSVNFHGPRYDHDVFFAVQCRPLSLEQLKEKSKLGLYLPSNARQRPAVVAGNLRGECWRYWTGNFDESCAVEEFLLPRGSSTYTVSWGGAPISNREQRKHLSSTIFFFFPELRNFFLPIAKPDEQALCRAVLSTFRFTEIKPTGYMTYRDPANRFSFEIPSNWNLNVNNLAHPQVSIRNGQETTIQIEVEQTTLREAQQSAGEKEWTPEQPWFAHGLSGSRRVSSDQVEYMFPKNGNLVALRIRRSAEPEDVMTRFLDSLQLGP